MGGGGGKNRNLGRGGTRKKIGKRGAGVGRKNLGGLNPGDRGTPPPPPPVLIAALSSRVVTVPTGCL